MAQHERVTFTQGHEVIEYALRYLREASEALDVLCEREQSERVSLLLGSVVGEQRNLLDAVERYLDDAPDTALATYAQYTVELPKPVGLPEAPVTALSLVQWLVGLNECMDTMFSKLASSAPTPEIAEAFDGLARQMQSHNRRLSKEHQRFEDL